MNKPTLRETLPLPSERPTWPQDVGDRFARGEATRPTMPFVRRDNEEGPIEFEWTAIGRDGEPHDFYQVFRSGYDMSLPGPTAGCVMMALLSIPPGKIGEKLEVQTDLSELASLCRLQKDGHTNRQLRRAIVQLQGLSIETNAFWDPNDQKYMDESKIALLSHYHFNADGEKEVVEVRWTSAAITLTSIWTKPVNLGHLFKLDSSLARKLYWASSLSIYQEGKMEEGLRDLCHERLGISRSREHPAELNRDLRGPVRSLREKNLIDVRSKKGPESPSIESEWVVRARPMEKMLEAEEKTKDPQC
jgi:hypothetical protein